MDEITTIIAQFQTALKLADAAEVQRQISAEIAGMTAPEFTLPVSGARKPYAKSPPKPCPTCGVLNTRRRFRFDCGGHAP